MLEFNLQDGILDTFQSFIRPPDDVVPLGYGFKIQSKADESHRLTMDEEPMYHDLSSSLQEIVDNILKRINPGGVHEAIWPVYTISVCWINIVKDRNLDYSFLNISLDPSAFLINSLVSSKQ